VGVSVEATVARPPEEVFPVVADGERLPEWMKDFERVEQLSDGAPRLGTEYRYKFKRSPESTFEWAEFEPGRRVAWDGPPLKTGPGSMRPRGGIDVEPAAEGSLVRVTLDPLPGGAMKVVLPLMRRAMRHGATENLSRLKAMLER
jgi:uncharacterized membrane protein